MTELTNIVESCCQKTCCVDVCCSDVCNTESVVAIVEVTDVAVIQLIAVQNKSGF